MNTFKEIRDGFNEVDTIQKQFATGEKAAAVAVTAHVLAYMLLGFTEGFVWATISYMIYATIIVSVILWITVIKETYYMVRRIMLNMEGMW